MYRADVKVPPMTRNSHVLAFLKSNRAVLGGATVLSSTLPTTPATTSPWVQSAAE